MYILACIHKKIVKKREVKSSHWYRHSIMHRETSQKLYVEVVLSVEVEEQLYNRNPFFYINPNTWYLSNGHLFFKRSSVNSYIPLRGLGQKVEHR